MKRSGLRVMGRSAWPSAFLTALPLVVAVSSAAAQVPSSPSAPPVAARGGQRSASMPATTAAPSGAQLPGPGRRAMSPASPPRERRPTATIGDIPPPRLPSTMPAPEASPMPEQAVPGLLPTPIPTADAVAVDDLPSTVSPAIEQFMRQGGPQLAPPPIGPSPAATIVRQEPMPDPRGRPRAVVPGPDGDVEDGPTAVDPVLVGPGVPTDPMAPPTGPLDLTLEPAPVLPTDVRFPINLATALRLADARPLVVAAAQAGAWVAEAQLARAKVLWVPTAIFGFDYIRHDGGGPDFNKGIMTAPSVNYFMGGGSAALYINFADAIFEPLVARQDLNAAHWDIQSAKNDALLRTADAYFRVHHYRGTFAGTLYTVKQGEALVEKVANLSRELVPVVEVDRARNMLADLEQRSSLARQQWRVASADLTQVLRLDPRAVVEPLEHDHAQITLVDPALTPDDLMPIALTNRPELASRLASVQAAEARVRREKWRPALPLFTLTGFQHAGMLLQGGIFGLGPNSSLDQWRGRSDVSFQFVWQLEGFGLGNLARVKQQRGRQSGSIIDYRRAQDAAAADVTRALARVQSAAARVYQADRALRAAIITFDGHLEGLGQTRRLADVLVLTYRPQEAVFSLEQLNVSFDEYFATVAEYNLAQFELFHALGYPADELTRLQPPGEVLPVDTGRPPYLPPVGNGPPPATR